MNCKRIVSLFLAIILIMSYMPMMLFAADITTDDDYFDKLMKSSSVSKAQIVIIKDGQIAYTYNFGCDENDSFKVFAISKSVLGILAAKMQDDGVIDLDTKIETYWRQLGNKNVKECSDDWNSYYGSAKTVATYTDPKVALVQNPATLRNCLTHSSTIKDDSMIYSHVATKETRAKGDFNRGEYFGGSIGSNYGMATFMLRHTWSQLFKKGGVPGKKTKYDSSKENLTREHALAGFTMQVATNVSLNEYLKKEILDKIDVSSNPKFAKVDTTILNENKTVIKRHNGNSMDFAAGYETSAVDLAKLITVVLNDGMYGNTRIMSQNAVNEIKKVEKNLKNQTIAFNYVNGKYEKGGRFYLTKHLGKYSLSQGNSYSYVSFEPETKTGVVFTVVGKTSAFNYKKFLKSVSTYASENFKEEHIHSYSDATCTEPKKCSCGATTGKALGHKFNLKGVCTRCGLVDLDKAKHKHVFSDATCTEPKKCSCGATTGKALGHKFNLKGVCTRCGLVDLDKAKHKHVFSDATCTEPKKCSCGATTGKALGHEFDSTGRCARCNAECVHSKLDQDGKCVECGKIVKIKKLEANKYSKTFKNYTEIRGSTCIVKNGATIQVLDADMTAVFVDDDSKATVEDSKIKITGVGKFNVTLKKNNQYMTATFFSWNVRLKGRARYWFYSDEARTKKYGIVYSNAYFAVEKTDNQKVLKVNEVLFGSGGKTDGKSIIGRYITNYYDQAKNKSTSQYYTYSF